jgi:hypothetical protein
MLLEFIGLKEFSTSVPGEKEMVEATFPDGKEQVILNFIYYCKLINMFSGKI